MSLWHNNKTASVRRSCGFINFSSPNDQSCVLSLIKITSRRINIFRNSNESDIIIHHFLIFVNKVADQVFMWYFKFWKYFVIFKQNPIYRKNRSILYNENTSSTKEEP